MTPFGKQILILAPHPDDEVAGCAAMIRRAQKQGAQLSVLFLTHGCLAQETMWPWERHRYTGIVANRLHEAHIVAEELNITPIDFSQRPARHLWRDMKAVMQEVRTAIKTHDFDQLWVPAYEGGNADHDGLNGLCSHLRDEISIIEFAEYNYASRQTNSQTFPFLTGQETVFALTPEEQTQKKAMLALYVSEQKNLGYIDVKQESYRPLADYDYSKPPHKGTLWYTRHHWVPFRHPRVDFTKPEEVCAALSKFS